MLYRKNMGGVQRGARLAAGGLIVACSLALIGATPLGIGLALGGVVTALTGVFGFCPACAMVGRR
jgi:hypothetical protein